MRRRTIAQLIGIGVVLGAIASAVAIFVPWLPEPASEQRDRIDFVFWFVTAICIAIFALVATISVYSVYKFRAQPDDDSDGSPIHGHTGLEIAWTAVPAVLVTAIIIVSAIVLARNERLPGDHLKVQVTSQQFVWSFKYPQLGGLTSPILRLPVDRAAELKFEALDVIHSFWVPEFGQKQDNVPGIETRLVITPDRVGSYPVVCTELCGLGHAFMRSQAVVMRPAAFDAWVSRARKALAGPPGQRGRTIFTSNGCGNCHTFSRAGSRSEVGPNLDKLPALARKADRPLREFIEESLVDPDAYIEPGFGNIMPPFDQLPEQQLDELIDYLATPGEGRR